jgi:spore germination protein KC
MFSKLCFPFSITLSILLALVISGCWDQVGFKERAIVIGMGIDKIQGDDPILLTVQVINLPTLKSGEGGAAGAGSSSGTGTGTEKKGSQAKSSVVVETSKGKSLDDAIHNFLKYSSRRMTFTHNRIVVLGNELATSGIASVFDDMARDYQFRATNWIFVAEKTAQEILESSTELGNVPAKEIDQMMINLTKNALILPINSNEFILNLKSEGNTSFTPLIQIDNSEQNHSQRIMIEKTAIFKNNRLIDILTPDESQSLLWFADKQKGGSLVFPYQSGKNQKKISVEISDGTTRITPHLTKDGIVMEIACTGLCTLYAMDGIENNTKTIKQLERIIEKIMEKRVESTIVKAQLIKADFLGFARIIHSEYPDVWRRIRKNWDKEFLRIKSKVHFQMNIARYGLVKDSILEIDKNGE